MKKVFLTAFIFLLTIGVFRVAFAAEPPAGVKNFSAEVVTKVGGQSMNGKLYVSNNKTRMETPENIIIARPDKGISWVLIPAQKIYMEQAMDPNDRTFALSKEIPGEIERKEVGTDTINGKSVKKVEVVAVQGPDKASIYQWLSDDFPIPLKLEAVDGSWSVAYNNLTIAAQPDSLFELPAGYKKFEVPGPSAVNPDKKASS